LVILWIGFAPSLISSFSSTPSTVGAALAAMLFLAGVGFMGAPFVALAFRSAFRPWLSAFPPSELAALAHPKHDGFALTVVPPVLGLGLIATGVGAVALDTRWAAMILGLGTTVALAIVAALVSQRLGRALTRDVERLRSRIEADADAGAPFGVDAWARDGVDRRIAELAEALGRATTAIRKSADAEKRAKSSIEAIQQKKTIFMASMSHDLRSPLNSIMGFSELLMSGIGGELTAGQRESVAVIQRSGSELLELLNDIIDSARLDASRLPLRRAWTPTVELLTEAISKGRELVELRAGTGTGFTIEEELEPGLPPLHVDSYRIVQAILCIFRHATRAMEGGAIRLSARGGEDGVRVLITDTGTALADDDREHAFQAFRAVTSTSGRRIGGMGLSLSLARSLVRAHGGDIRYDASSRDGTTFVIFIPASGAAS
jgi:signal transduction histidine kinase